MSAYRLIIDCGTTNLRVTLLDGETVLGQEKAEGGVRHTAIDGHNGRLKESLRGCIAAVLERYGVAPEQIVRCVASGMITSNMGLLEIPHLIAPAGAAQLRAGMQEKLFEEIAPFPIAFIPGVRNFGGAVTIDNCGGMDMMRGEETEAVGLHALLKPEGEALFILPGSHNKFVSMDAQGRITGCMTSISGELLAAITQNTILADAVGRGFASAEEYDSRMACEGAWECEHSGLGRAAFAGRILSTLGGMQKSAVRSYLLGAVMALDVKALGAFVKEPENTRIYIAGKAPVSLAVRDVLGALGIEGAEIVPAEISGKMGVTGALTIAG